jgi:hypothetical protein
MNASEGGLLQFAAFSRFGEKRPNQRVRAKRPRIMQVAKEVLGGHLERRTRIGPRQGEQTLTALTKSWFEVRGVVRKSGRPQT